MIDGSEKRDRQLAFERQNSHVCEKRSKLALRECQLKISHFLVLFKSDTGNIWPQMKLCLHFLPL